ncbi:ABC transporter substrate-binding protein [Desulfogranum japonicum]|uniref:ABC transporter substrate-binding protein n=1 Tax=Desulfogranum japonicum TaxID=231447 RepID=UPI0005574A77|nr:ABC transporter substrate-binding protein [Desulfogranum japonicum]
MFARITPLSILFYVLVSWFNSAFAVTYMEVQALQNKISTPVGEVRSKNTVQVPLITWGGDEATILANGNAATTSSGSIFSEKGLHITLTREDIFTNQIKNYLKGDTPYIRGTLGMLNMALGVLNKDPRTRPIVIYQLTWSNGGDCLVVKDGIRTAKDLQGKTIALQAYGPHVYYLSKVLSDAGLSLRDVTVKWVKDLTGTAETPMEAFYDSNVDAALMISTDGLLLTSNGTVGTGAEGSVKGAKILLSTKTANRVISDVYAVRSDYYQSHRQEVERFVHGLMLAEEQFSHIVKNSANRQKQYMQTMTAAAQILLDSPDAVADAEALYGDCEFVGFAGNVRFLTDSNYPRNLQTLADQVQSALITLGLLDTKITLTAAELDYTRLKQGLTEVEDVVLPKFDTAQVSTLVQRKQQQGALEEGELFSFEVFFQPNQNTFAADMYAKDFDRVIDLASTYGGAIITVEGHSDPLGYLKAKKRGDSKLLLTKVKQSAKNLSLSRANAVRTSLINYASKRGIIMDETQFAVVGHGIMKPRNGLCGSDPCAPKTEQQWRDNMRVEFRIIQIEAESSVFKPL